MDAKLELLERLGVLDKVDREALGVFPLEYFSDHELIWMDGVSMVSFVADKQGCDLVVDGAWCVDGIIPGSRFTEHYDLVYEAVFFADCVMYEILRHTQRCIT